MSVEQRGCRYGGTGSPCCFTPGDLARRVKTSTLDREMIQLGMEPKIFRVVLRGRLSARFESAFEGMELVPGTGETALVGSLDQAQLWGILERAREFGLELLRIEEVSE